MEGQGLKGKRLGLWNILTRKVRNLFERRCPPKDFGIAGISPVTVSLLNCSLKIP